MAIAPATGSTKSCGTSSSKAATPPISDHAMGMGRIHHSTGAVDSNRQPNVKITNGRDAKLGQLGVGPAERDANKRIKRGRIEDEGHSEIRAYAARVANAKTAAKKASPEKHHPLGNEQRAKEKRCRIDRHEE